MTDAERIDEAIERDPAALLDRREEIADRGLAVAFLFFEADRLVALLQREDVGRFAHPAFVEEQFDLLFAEPLDVEGAARCEQFQMLDLLVRTGEFAGAAQPRAFLPGRSGLAHDFGVQRARALFRKAVGLGVLWTFLDDHVDDLRDHIARALDNDRVADADIPALAQHLPTAADAFDVILVVQGHVLDDDATDADRIELRRRCQRAGAADSNQHAAHHGERTLRGELVRDGPARRARDEAKPLLPVQTIDFVHDAVDVVVELGAFALDFAMEGDHLLD